MCSPNVPSSFFGIDDLYVLKSLLSALACEVRCKALDCMIAGRISFLHIVFTQVAVVDGNSLSKATGGLSMLFKQS